MREDPLFLMEKIKHSKDEKAAQVGNEEGREIYGGYARSNPNQQVNNQFINLISFYIFSLCNKYLFR